MKGERRASNLWRERDGCGGVVLLIDIYDSSCVFGSVWSSDKDQITNEGTRGGEFCVGR